VVDSILSHRRERYAGIDTKTLETIHRAMQHAHKFWKDMESKPPETFEELRAVAKDHVLLSDDHLHLLRTEPKYLSEVLKIYFNSNAKLIPDGPNIPNVSMSESFSCTRIFIQAFLDAYEAQGNWNAIIKWK
jgi:hypothetical protein